jgi:hypothetical protein
MLNVQALTSTLSAMSLPQLQQYASLHKNDPYVVTMALSIANQKKQMQTAAQGQVGQQPMPKVVDQEIGQMAAPAPQATPMPEEVGIGQLPAPNIAKMAGGGIVAFGDGGEVPRYQSQGLVMAPSAGTQFGIPGMVSQGSFSPQPGAQDDQTWAQKKLAQLEAKVEAGTATPQERAWVSMFGKPKTAQPVQPMQMGSNLGATDASLGAAGESAVTKLAPTPAPSGAQTGAPNANAQPFQTPQLKMPGFKPSEAVPVPTADDLRTRYSTLLGSDPYYDPMEARQKAINAQAAESKQKGITALENDIKAEGLYGVEREKRIGERETKLTKDESINASMAILSAGLGTLAGTSPFFGANLGEGGKQGIAAYIKGKEKIDSARERLDDARDKLEDIRRNESVMNKREVRAAKTDLENTLLQGQRELLAGTRQAYGQNSQLANTMLGIQMNAEDTARKIASNEKIAVLDAQTRVAVGNKPSEQMAMALALGNGDLKAGLTTFSQIQADAQSGKWNPRDAYTQYLLGWNKNAQSNPIYAQENPMLNFTSFLAQFTIPTGGGNASSSMAGKDRARPAG